MAIYHCNISVASRAEGHSAVAGAAYLSRSRIACERDGLTHDYTRAHRHERLVADLGVTLPEAAPERWLDRPTLWNEVERVERSSKAQLCRRIEYALPDELDEASQVELARRVARDFADMGMVVDCCVHKGVDGTNCHAHMLMPLRSCDADGFLAKSENLYHVRDAAGTEADLSARELRELNGLGRGFEKVYTWRLGGERRQLTPTEAASWQGCERVGKTPVQSTRYLNDWNEPTKAEEWRALVARRCNEALAAGGHEARVDHRSYERQGVDRVPTLHEGSRVHALEARARAEAEAHGAAYEPVTDIRQENVDRGRLNALISRAGEVARGIADEIRSARARAAEAAREAVASWTRGLERARVQLVRTLTGRGRDGFEAARDAYAAQSRTRAVAAKKVVPARARAAEAALRREATERAREAAREARAWERTSRGAHRGPDWGAR